MKPSLMIALLLSITSFSTAAMLFLDSPRTSTLTRVMPQSPLEIKWGEGSEAGVPEATSQKH
jgi:hypothetical protein